MSFTKGPWNIFESKIGLDLILKTSILDAEDQAICWIVERDNKDKSAHLIAAAPEMYEMIDKINAAFYTRTSKKEWMDLMEKTKPLLQKARGEIPE